MSILLILFKVHEGVLKFSQNNNVEFAKVLVHNIVFLQRLKNWRLFIKRLAKTYHARVRIVIHMDLSKRKCLLKAFLTSQFNYCPLMWMFHSRELNNRINRIHERPLRFGYQDNSLPSAELLANDNSVTIHQRNLQVLATEIFKLKYGLAPEKIKEVFEIQNPAYNFRSEGIHFERENLKTTHYDIHDSI